VNPEILLSRLLTASEGASKERLFRETGTILKLFRFRCSADIPISMGLCTSGI
jgi:hypothetical protein